MVLSLVWVEASEIVMKKAEAFDANKSLTHETKLLSHKPNYILFLNRDFDTEEDRLQEEAMFQFSIKKKLTYTLFGYDSQLFFGYTQKSFWQVYDGERSRPFRETNYNPELFVSTEFDDPFVTGGFQKLYWGYEHESNGGDIATSRSWDRLYAQLFYRHDNLLAAVKVWSRFHENKKKNPDDPYGDDNPQIIDYYGYGDVTLTYNYYGHQFGLFFRKRAVAVDLSIPLGGDSQYLYFRYFDGYGESLIDYDRYLQKAGFGVQISR